MHLAAWQTVLGPSFHLFQDEDTTRNHWQSSYHINVRGSGPTLGFVDNVGEEDELNFRVVECLKELDRRELLYKAGDQHDAIVVCKTDEHL